MKIDALVQPPLPELTAVGLLAGAGLTRFVGGPDTLSALLVCCAVGVGVLGFGLRAALDSHRDGVRLGGAAVVFLAALVAVATAATTVFPGSPETELDLVPGTPASLQGVKPGEHRMLVTGHLPQGNDDTAYDLAVGGGEHVLGHFVRTHGKSRVGRSGSAVTSAEHTANFHDVQVPSEGSAIDVHLNGNLEGPVHVALYPTVPAAALYAVLALGFIGAAALDERGRAGLRLATPVGTGLLFALVMHLWGSPVGATGPAMGAMILGFIGAAAGGWILTRLLRPMVGAEPVPAPVRRGR